MAKLEAIKTTTVAPKKNYYWMIQVYWQRLVISSSSIFNNIICTRQLTTEVRGRMDVGMSAFGADGLSGVAGFVNGLFGLNPGKTDLV